MALGVGESVTDKLEGRADLDASNESRAEHLGRGMRQGGHQQECPRISSSEPSSSAEDWARLLNPSAFSENCPPCGQCGKAMMCCGPEENCSWGQFCLAKGCLDPRRPGYCWGCWTAWWEATKKKKEKEKARKEKERGGKRRQQQQQPTGS